MDFGAITAWAVCSAPLSLFVLLLDKIRAHSFDDTQRIWVE
jgi:hypothetical protein